jgi:hypothetical protein
MMKPAPGCCAPAAARRRRSASRRIARSHHEVDFVRPRTSARAWTAPALWRRRSAKAGAVLSNTIRSSPESSASHKAAETAALQDAGASVDDRQDLRPIRLTPKRYTPDANPRIQPRPYEQANDSLERRGRRSHHDPPGRVRFASKPARRTRLRDGAAPADRLPDATRRSRCDARGGAGPLAGQWRRRLAPLTRKLNHI